MKEVKELELLEALSEEPEARQVDLAARLGVAVGTINWHLKRLAAKGYIKVRRIGRWRWGYILTPQGMAEKARLTVSYVRRSMSLYREVRGQCSFLLQQVMKAGYREVVLDGEGDLVDVCRLTCLEQGIHPLTTDRKERDVPILQVQGMKIELQWPDEPESLVSMRRTIGYSEYEALLKTFVNLVQQVLGDQVVSVVLYGSVARGTAMPNSDVDLLLILQEAPAGYWKRLQPLLPLLRRLRKGSHWKRLEGQGMVPSVNLLVFSLEEAKENRYLYLDMVDEARILVDREGFFQGKLESLRQRLHELGARKVRRNGDWYWDLKPDLKPGEAIVL